MPLKKTALKLARKLVCMDTQEQEEAGPIAIQPRLEPDEDQAVEPGRPYQAFVESEVRKYWHEIQERSGNLTKPSQEEIRAAAMPVLCLALRNRRGSRKHQAVADIVQHAMEQSWIKRPFSEAYASPSYIDALIQLAIDAKWLAIEIPLPAHPQPYHPLIYYTIISQQGRYVPVPRENALIRGGYLYQHKWTHSRLTNASNIYPWLGPWYRGVDRDLLDSGRVYYSLSFGLAEGPIYCRPVHITIHWKDHTKRYVSDYLAADIRRLHFSPYQLGRKQV